MCPSPEGKLCILPKKEKEYVMLSHANAKSLSRNVLACSLLGLKIAREPFRVWNEARSLWLALLKSPKLMPWRASPLPTHTSSGLYHSGRDRRSVGHVRKSLSIISDRNRRIWKQTSHQQIFNRLSLLLPVIKYCGTWVKLCIFL